MTAAVADGPPPVEVRGLVKRYGELTAVAGVDLTVETGDVYGYLGPNGAGKTTSLRMMLGLITPNEGTVRLFGRDPMQSVNALQGVAGFVEAPTFYPYLTGRRNLELLASYDGYGARTRLDDALDTVELADRARDRVGGYSHGMRQRLGIAAALLRQPKLLLLDEPATGLDPAGMRDMRVLIRRLADEGITVVLSSHLLAEVEELCNRVAIVRSGKIVYEGEIAALKRGAGTQYSLSTTDDERALSHLCRAQPGVADVRTEHGRIAFTADESSVAQLSQALVEAGALIRMLAAPQTGVVGGPVLLAHRGDRRRPRRTTARAGRGGAVNKPGVLTVYRWELIKLKHLKRTYLGLGGAVLVPILFVLAIHFRHHSHGDFAFASYLDRSGLAVPLVILLFGAVWMFPLITALVAGDIFASEDHNGTLKTIFTRSLERSQIFGGKTLAAITYGIAAILLSGTVAVVAGTIQSGFNSLPQELVGDDRLGSEGARARLREHADLPDPDPERSRLHRSAALDRDPETARPRSSAP